MTAERWLTVRSENGRDVEVLVEGPDSGPVLIFHDGTPTAAVPFPPLSAPAMERGLRTVTFSRPGYAASTPQPGRSVASVVADTAAILDALGEERFLTIGWSGGGPHALACAALLPDRCTAAATLASVAPYGVAGLDWLAGMGPENIEEFGAALDGEERLNPYLEREAAVLREVTGSDVAAALGGLVSDVDRRALTGDYAALMAQTFRRAVSAGIAGWRDDDLASRDRGDSTSIPFASRSSSGRAMRTGWCLSRTVNGSPPTSRGRVRGSCRATATSPWSPSSGASSTNCW
jgi:pimeloyl-ACP methyl ester carboxylesterase